MKTWEAFIKTTDRSTGEVKQFKIRVDAENEFLAVNKFKTDYGQDCLLGGITETKNYGPQSVGY